MKAVHSAREGLSYRFRSAIVRLPGKNVVNGLRDVDRGKPDLTSYLAEHAHYRAALRETSVEVHVLPALEAFPDSVFVEDTALCLPEGVIILRPGAPSRRGEADAMAKDCARLGLPVQNLDSGTVDGGDILVTDSEILVGVSARTSREGFDQLGAIVGNWGYAIRMVHTPEQVLHFKSDCSVLGPDTILATSRLADETCFSDYNVLEVPHSEEAAANSIRVNDTVLVPAGYQGTARLIEDAGFRVVTVPATQAGLLDGGLSCQSLRY